jgi:hypothetical protein
MFVHLWLTTSNKEYCRNNQTVGVISITVLCVCLLSPLNGRVFLSNKPLQSYVKTFFYFMRSVSENHPQRPKKQELRAVIPLLTLLLEVCAGCVPSALPSFRRLKKNPFEAGKTSFMTSTTAGKTVQRLFIVRRRRGTLSASQHRLGESGYFNISFLLITRYIVGQYFTFS